jgi:hypothetical protein
MSSDSKQYESDVQETKSRRLMARGALDIITSYKEISTAQSALKRKPDMQKAPSLNSPPAYNLAFAFSVCKKMQFKILISGPSNLELQI